MGIPATLPYGALGLPPQDDQANAVVAGTFSAVGPSLPFEFFGPFNLSLWGAINTALTVTGASLAFSAVSGTGLVAGDAVNSTLVPRGTTIATISGTAGTLAVPPVSQWGQINPNNPQLSGLAVTEGLLGAAVSGIGIPSGTTVSAILVDAIPGNSAVPIQKGTVLLSHQPTRLTTKTENFNQGSALVFQPNGNAILASGTDAAATFTGSAIDFAGTVTVERSFDGAKTWITTSLTNAGAVASYNAGTPVSTIFNEPEDGVLWRLNCTVLTSGTINYRLSCTGAAATSLGRAPGV